MKKLILISSIFILLIFTTITKNSTKEIEKQIYNMNESLTVLKQKYEMLKNLNKQQYIKKIRV